MIVLLKKLLNDFKQINMLHKIWFGICIAILLSMILANTNTVFKLTRIEEVKAFQKEITNYFEKKKNSKNCPYRQDNKIPGIVLINYGENNMNDNSSESIHNIFLVIFEKNNKKGRLNILGLQKETCVAKNGNRIIKLKDSFDKNNPQGFYKAIKMVSGYDVDSFVIYNNDTIKKLMDIFYVVNVNVVVDEFKKINDVPVLNSEINKYAKKYNISNNIKIKAAGRQLLHSAQILSYINMYYDEWECEKNDWRHVFVLLEFSKIMKNSNYYELEKVKSILNDGVINISKKRMIQIASAIKEYDFTYSGRWPLRGIVMRYKGQKYYLPEIYSNYYEELHITIMGEKKYKSSLSYKKYKTILENIIAFINDYNNALLKEDTEDNLTDSFTDNNRNRSNNSNYIEKRTNTTKENSKSKQEKTVEPKSEPEPLPDPAVEPDTPSEPVAPAETEDQSKTNSTEPEE